MRLRAVQFADLHQPHVVLPLWRRGEDFQGVVVEMGSDDGFDEQARRGQHVGRGGVDRAVQTQHRAEGAQRVALHRPLQGRDQRIADSRAAGIVVLDHHRRRIGELADDRQGAVEIEEIVVGKLLAVQLPRGDHVGPVAVGPGIEGRLLMGILAVAEAHLVGSSRS